MNKKGFTLIELLAVIVILAIIAIIAIPLILNVVEKAKKKAAENSAYGYLDAVEKQIVINAMNKTNEITDGEYDLPLASKYQVKVKGKAPTNGTLTIEKSKIKTAEMCINNYTVSYANNKATVTKKCTEETIDAEDVEYKSGQSVADALDELRSGN